jgi:hypothetical protein
LGDFKITLKVTALDGLFSQKVFDIKTVTPSQAINETLDLKQRQLEDLSLVIDSLPTWYNGEIKSFADVDNYVYEIDRLKTLRDSIALDETYLTIAKDLYSLDIPSEIRLDTNLGLGLVDRPALINLLPVASYSGGVSLDYVDSYNQPVFNWQGMKVQTAISKDEIILTKSSGITSKIMSVYSLDLIHRDDFGEAYLVIDKPRGELYFEGVVDAKSSEGFTLIPLNPNEWYSINFYYKGESDLNFYVSPVLSNIVLTDLIIEDCNYNLFCEEGENWKTCRMDCKPLKLAIIYYILAFFFVLIIYILLQLWYANSYEGHLFGDKNQLYNLLMYISNARARGFNDSKIADELRSQGWSGEKINYAIRKSRGKSTGLPEIIPFSKFRARKIKNKVQNISQGGQTFNAERNFGSSGQSSYRY